MTDMKLRAQNARDDLDGMLDVAQAIRISATATADQISAASAARRSILSALQSPTDIRRQVVQSRFEKLIAVL